MTFGFAALVLAGGRARRLGGTDKATIRIGGRTLLDRTLDAVSGADPVVVVGPSRVTRHEVVWTRETPAGGGPLAGLDAGLRMIPEHVEVVALLAADHPHVTEETLSRLTESLSTPPPVAGCVLSDAEGAPQWLLGVWRTRVLRERMPGEVRDQSLRKLLRPLEPRMVAAAGSEASDIDTPQDLRRSVDELGP